MRKLFSTLSSTLQGGVRGGLLFLSLVATTSLWAEDFSVGGIYYNYLDGNNVEVTYRGYYDDSYDNEYSGAVAIPSTITYYGTTYSVTSIGDGAFAGCSSLTSVTIPNSVTSIGEAAFYDCSSLASVTIPNSVTSIGSSAFSVCSSLTSVTIPNSVTSIEDHAFQYCSSLTSITIPNSVTSIGESAFYNCSSLTTITIPNSVTSIGYKAFLGCSSLPVENNLRYADTYLVEAVDETLSTYSIKEGTKWIGDYAFYDCSSLTSVTIPNSVTSIGDQAFSSCSSLTSVTIGNSVTSIGYRAFYDCYSLATITIPNSVTSIGDYAFYDCSSLTKLVYNAHCFAYMPTPFKGAYVIPDGIKQIAGGAFSDCSSLTSITIPNSVTSIGSSAFYRCSSLATITIPESVTSIGSSAFLSCSSLTSITIPNSVTSIRKYAFYNCSSLTSITIPESVTSIGDYTFYSCSKLTSITCEAETPPTVGQYAFDGVSKSIPVYVPCGCVEAYKAANGWKNFTNIQEALAEYSIEVDVNDNIMGTATVDINSMCGAQISAKPTFGYHFVQWSDGNTDNPRTLVLTKDTILTAEFTLTQSGQCGDNLYWELIDDTLHITGTGAMYDYTYDAPWKRSIKVLRIGECVTSIGDYAFYRCSSLTSVAIPNSVTSIGDGAFSGCSYLTSVTIPNSVTSIEYGAFEDCSKLTSVTINSNAIVSKDYSYNSNISRIFGSQVTEYIIGDDAKGIGSCAFYNCYRLTSITIPNSVTSIGDDAFYGCSSLTSITIPNSVTSIGDDAFNRCSALTSVTIPNSVTSIGDDAFSGCSSLTSITIPNSVTSIEDRAFQYCSSLTSITIPNSVTSIGWRAFGDCSSLTSITIPNSVTSIGDDAFRDCSSLDTLTCLAMTPPALGGYVFDGCDNPTLFVPCAALSDYQLHGKWGQFTNIECISSEEADTEDVIIESGTTTITITWPTEEGADTYTIVIKKDGEVVCTLTFNSEGQLINIAFAPGRNGNHPAQYAEAVANGKGFRFTVTGLEDGTHYTYNIDVKNTADQTINSHSGEFTTQSTTAVDNITTTTANIQKILRDGQLLILRDGVEYNAIGVRL